MTTMLHTALPDATDFDVRRQLGELASVVASDGGLDLPRRGLHRLAARLAPGGHRDRPWPVWRLSRPDRRSLDVPPPEAAPHAALPPAGDIAGQARQR